MYAINYFIQQIFKQADCFIWDKTAITHRYVFGAINSILKDVKSINDNNSKNILSTK